uniref:BZIP domain-containing protein n=1 Tax=Clastoptera arizonana TaxID=38151 RepID=A0A1B6CKR6_9HEMI
MPKTRSATKRHNNVLSRTRKSSCNSSIAFTESNSFDKYDLNSENLSVDNEEHNYSLEINKHSSKDQFRPIFNITDKYNKNRRISVNSNKLLNFDCSSSKSGQFENTYVSKNKAMSKNALNAKLNRLKHKQYLMQLHNELEVLKKENTTLKSCSNYKSEMIHSLNNEVQYLKNIIANSTELGSILRNVCHKTNLEIISPLNKGDFMSHSVKSKLDAHLNMFDDDSETNGLISGIYQYSLPPSPDNFSISDLPQTPFLNSFEDPFICKYSNDSFSDINFNLLEMDALAQNEDLALISNEEMNSWEKSPLECDIPDFQDVGVCLHLSKKKVSLEFCSSCNQSSTSSSAENMNHSVSE